MANLASLPFMGRLHIVVSMHLLNVNSVLHLNTLQLTGFVELLTTTKFLNDTRLVEFAFEFLNRALDVLAFFYWYYDHTNHLLSL